MRSMPKGVKIAVLVFVVILLLAQAIRIDRSNPLVRSDLPAAHAVKPILRRACYNCHSNETIWPWYSGLAPASWLVGNDVKEGREHLNFSEWGVYDSGTQSHKLRGIAEEVQGGEMPPWYYSMVHRQSRLSPAERDQILAWTAETIQMGIK
jgi:hypothetical protein